MNRSIATIILLSSLTGWTAHAEDFCVDTADEFQEALEDAEINGQNNHIKLVSGVYLTSDNGIPGQGFEHQNLMPGSLTISGGWSLSGSGNCFFTRVRDPAFATVLSGIGADRVLTLAIGHGDANIILSNLAIYNGYPYNDFSHTGGLWIRGFADGDLINDVLLDRLVFIGNEGNYSSALRVDSTGRVDIKNSLFRHNTVNISYTASIYTSHDESIYFTNNSVISNDTNSTNGVSGVLLSNTFTGGAVAANNIFWDNTLWDVVFSGTSANHHLLHNIYQTATGHAGIEINNLNSNPLLNTDYSLSPQSPAINAGLTPPENNPNPPVELNWTVGDHDVRSYARTQGSSTDLGAMETVDYIFGSGFD